MIFYNPDCDHKFTEYGIEIPIADSRSDKVFESLKYLYPFLSYTDLSTLIKITKDDLLRVHQKDFIDRLFESEASLQHEIFQCYELIDPDTGAYHRFNPNNQKKPWKDLLNIILSQVAMTYTSATYALEHGFAYSLGGGMHHSMSFGGRGFCLVNDSVIALKKLQAEGKIKTAWIVDVDVHKGDGAPELLKDDKSISTFSIHMKEGWPLDSGSVNSPWFIPSTLDAPIGVGEENIYLESLEKGLEQLEKIHPSPDMVIVINGADPYEFDELPSSRFIKLTKEEMLKRDKLLYHFFKSRNIPQSYVMAGGYGQKSWEIYLQFLKFVGENSTMWPKVSSR